MRDDVLEKQVNGVNSSSIVDEVLESGLVDFDPEWVESFFAGLALPEVLEQESILLTPRINRGRPKKESLFEPESSEDLQARIFTLKADLEGKEKKLGEVVANFSKQKLTAPQRKKIRNLHNTACLRVEKKINFIQNKLAEQGLKQENEKLRAELELLIFARGESTSSDQGSSKGLSAEEQKQREIARSIAEEWKCKAEKNLAVVKNLNKKSKNLSQKTKRKNRNRAASTLCRINRKCENIEQEDRLLSARNENTLLKERIALLSPREEYSVVLPVLSLGLFGGELNSHVDEQPLEDIYPLQFSV